MEKFVFNVREDSRELLSGLSMGYIHFSEVKNSKCNQEIDKIIENACRLVREKFRGKEISDEPILRAMRSIYSKIGIDPTKDRPSGEALIRRVVGGKGIYRINAVVDANNAVSLLTGFPCGVYDAEKIEGGRITVSVAKEGEFYEGIGGARVDAGNKIVTSDVLGYFGGPTADSKRTCVSVGTREVLMLIYCHESGNGGLENAIEIAKESMAKAAGASAIYSGILSIG